MILKPIIMRSRFIFVVISLLLIMSLFHLPAANAEGSVTIKQISVNKQSVFPGETVKVTIAWTNETGLVVAATVNCTGGSTTYSKQVNFGPSGTTQIEFPIDYLASTGDYHVKVATGKLLMQSLTKAFTVKSIDINAKNLSPSQSSPVDVYAGDSVNVSFKYSSQADTQAKIAIGSLATKTINLKKSSDFASAGTSLVIPEGAAAGDYNLKLSFAGSETVYTESKAVRVKKKPTVDLNVTSPTGKNPATVRPGDNLTVKFSYTATNDTPVYVRLIQSNNTVLVSKEVTLSKSKTTGSTALSIPTNVAAGRYNLIVVPKAGGGALDTKQESVIVENKVTATITSPTRSKPVSVTGGDKVNVTFNYTADNKSNVEVRIQQSDGKVLHTSTVSLDRATSTKTKSVSITIPSSAGSGKYDLVVRTPVSGTALDIEREAFNVDAKMTAEISSPTKSKSVTVKSGDSLQVKFNYTSSAESNVVVKVLKPDGKVLASNSASLNKTSTKKSRTVMVDIPSGAASGKHDVRITSKYSGKVLDTEKQAVIIEDPVSVKIQSPTKTNPVRFNTTGKLHVEFKYTAESSGNAEFRLLKPSGKVLASNSIKLSKTTTSKSKNIIINLPAATPEDIYDLEVINKNTDNRIALETKAVTVVSYPLNVQVKFVIGKSGRWVNGAFQNTDLDARIIQNRTLLPIRHVGEPLGWELKWDEKNKMATVIKGARQVRVWLNNSSGKVSTNNGSTWKTVKIDPNNSSVQPLLISGRVLLPLRFVSEALDTEVDWDSASRTVIVSQ